MIHVLYVLINNEFPNFGAFSNSELTLTHLNTRDRNQLVVQVRKVAKIRHRYNQVAHLTQDTTLESDKTQLNITNGHPQKAIAVLENKSTKVRIFSKSL